DIVGSVGRRLTKVHGCACRSVSDSTKRNLMVATRSELQAWQTSHDRDPIKELVRNILRERPSLFVGISGQDWNIQVEVLTAFANLDTYVSLLPTILFAQGSLTQAQRTVLRHMLGDSYTSNPTVIEQKSTLGLYSKPFLGALYILTLRRKLDIAIKTGTDE